MNPYDVHNDHYLSVGRRKVKAGPVVKWFHFEIVGDSHDLMLIGCVVDGVYVRGPCKGRPKYDGPPRTAFVAFTEAVAEFERYERDTGRCGTCMGTGELFASSGPSGTKYRACHRCAGTGSARRPA